MPDRVDWTSWEPWGKLWDEWMRVIGSSAMEHIQFIDLYNFFVRQVKALGIDPHIIDVKAYLDPSLTYEENKTILAEIMRVPPSEAEYQSMYESYKNELFKEVEEKYPEVVEEFTKRIAALERDVEALPKVEREREKFRRLSEELKYELEETKRRAKQEREALEKKVAPVKLRIIRGFKEGILEYSAGSIVETRDVEWALQKIEKGFAERVVVGVPEVRPPPPVVPPVFKPPAKPPEKPPVKVLPPVPEKCPIDGTPLEEVTRVPMLIKDPLTLSAEEEYFRARSGLPLPTAKVEWIEIPATMKVWMCKGEPQHYFERDALGRLVERTPEYLYRKILRETAKLRRIEAPAVAPEFVPPEVRTRFLEWMRRWEAPEAGKKAFQLHPKDWLLTKGIAWGDFLKKSDEERKALMNEYDRLVRERK